MKRAFSRNKKGMSIIISTVIIIAISITMAIAVAFWAMGVGNSFTRFEKLEFVSIYADLPQRFYFSAGTRATAVAIISGGAVVEPIQVTNGGSGYSSLNPPDVVFSGGGGSGAAATAVVQSGRVATITVTSGGSGYTSAPIITIEAPASAQLNAFPIYIQLKNTGSAAATINNVFLNGKPYTAYPQLGQTGGQNLVGTVLNVGVRNNNLWIRLPVSTTWSSGDYVEVEIETSAGRTYSNTVLLP